VVEDWIGSIKRSSAAAFGCHPARLQMDLPVASLRSTWRDGGLRAVERQATQGGLVYRRHLHGWWS